MEENEISPQKPDGSEEAKEVVAARRRRAPGVVIGSDADEGVGAVAQEPEQSEPKKRRTVAKKASAEPDEKMRSDEAVPPAPSPEKGLKLDESEAEKAEKEEEGEKPAKKRRRSRRSGSKTVPDERSGPVGSALINVDQEELSEKSWELFRREIQENGMEIIDDREARKLAARSMDIVKMYLEERARLNPSF